MRKEYGKALRDLFQIAMAEALPDFVPEKVNSDYIFPGGRTFRHAVDEKLHLWIILCPDLKGHEQFTVEIGWSRLGRFPELGMRPMLGLNDSADIYAEAEYVQRLAQLWSEFNWWWKLPRNPVLQSLPAPEAKNLVRPHVTDAVQKLSEFSPRFLLRSWGWRHDAQLVAAAVAQTALRFGFPPAFGFRCR